MAKRTVTSLVPTEQNTLSRIGNKLPKELVRQDRAAKIPQEASAQTPPKAKSLKQTVTEDYYNSRGEAQVRASSTKFTSKSD